ncbi:unnamed protein product [Effrenium voratum]|uniref:Uncharacterized protein n=1 Tax=Effrenium voratum TaxID=2562239 RepID=A0AA36HJT6_9DINO|nr:unnamed protein product [Effrenium voratum]
MAGASMLQTASTISSACTGVYTDIPFDAIQKLFPDHQALQVFLTPADVGHAGMRRARTFIYLRHRERCQYLWDIYDTLAAVTRVISKTVKTKPSDYLISSPQTRSLEAAIFSRKRKMAETNMWYLLNDREKQVVRQLDSHYHHKFDQPAREDQELFYFLGDRYEFSRTWSAVRPQALPTYRKNAGKYLHRQSMTFLTSQEKLASLGWPVTAETASEAGTTPLPSLDALRSDMMAGNSMHLSCAGVILFCGMCCFGVTPGTSQ